MLAVGTASCTRSLCNTHTLLCVLLATRLDRIYKNLYLGGQEPAKSKKWLKKRQIKLVINVAGEFSKDASEKLARQRFLLRVPNRSDANVLGAMLSVKSELLTAIENEEAVLIHCEHGRSR